MGMTTLEKLYTLKKNLIALELGSFTSEQLAYFCYYKQSKTTSLFHPYHCPTIRL